jgi:hypothetical protein
MNEIFLIERAWIDPMENLNVDGYDLIGFVRTEEEAQRICTEGGYYTSKDCWSIQFYPEERLRKFKYTKLLPFNNL